MAKDMIKVQMLKKNKETGDTYTYGLRGGSLGTKPPSMRKTPLARKKKPNTGR